MLLTNQKDRTMTKKDKNIEHYKNQDAFNVPENYFEEFAHDMQIRISNSVNKEKWYHKLAHGIRPKLSIPASFALALAYFAFISQPIKENKDLVLSNNEIQVYLLNEFESNNDDEIYELAIEEGFVEEPILIKDEDIIQYLIEEDEIDIQTINDYI